MMKTAAPIELPDVLFKELLDKIHAKKSKIAIMGLGYVGLPLALTLFKKGFEVIGFDVDPEKIVHLNRGTSYIHTIPGDDIKILSQSERFTCSTDPKMLCQADAILICVPTPLTKNREPDMTYILETTKLIAQNRKKGQLIVLESTTYPGTTEEVVRPLLEKQGDVQGIDFFLAYSPEREDPGNPDFSTAVIPKVIGADDEKSLELAEVLYSQLVPGVILVSSARTAEAVKLTENIFRSTNIALVNELKLVFSRMGIDIWEVIEAAKSKPFGFMPFYPGPGLGGHCIPIDPFYLTWKAREYGLSTRFVELAGEINTSMPLHVVTRLQEELDMRLKKGLNGAKILIVGMAYKKNVDDVRESPSLIIFELLKKRHVEVSYYDPYIREILPTREHPGLSGERSIEWSKGALSHFDAAIICTDHDNIDYGFLVKSVPLVLDTRNATHFLKEKQNVAKA